MKPVKLVIVGHKLVTRRHTNSDGVTEMLPKVRVEFEGPEGDVVLYLDRALMAELPLGDGATASLDVKQLEMGLDVPSPARANGRGRKGAPAAAAN